MANEISIFLSVTASKNGGTVSASGSKTITMAGEQMIANVQIVGLTEEPLFLGDVATGGWLFVKNLDTTNSIKVHESGGESADHAITLLAGEFALLKPTSGLYATAFTAPCNVQVLAIEL